MIEVVIPLLGIVAMIVCTCIVWSYRYKIAKLIIDNPDLSNEKAIAICELGSKDININTSHS